MSIATTRKRDSAGEFVGCSLGNYVFFSWRCTVRIGAGTTGGYGGEPN